MLITNIRDAIFAVSARNAQIQREHPTGLTTMIKAAVRIGLLFVFISAMTSGAFAEVRVALVIGNSNYEHAASLPNPKNDAEDLTGVLRRIGFDVTIANNLDFNAMRRKLRDFAREASRADMALVFFAGHGMELNKHNYLIPTDAQLVTDQDIEYEAVPLDLVINAVRGARHLGLVLLDACRNNPFAASMKNTSSTRSVGRGLARVEPAAGTLVSYAAKEGTIADDGRGRNSPYTKALIAHLEQPGLEINFLFRKVRDSVFKSTNGTQEPFTYGSLPGKKIYLKAPETGPVAAVEPVPRPQGGFDREALFWSSVRDSNDPNMLEAYLDKFPDGLYAALARAKLIRLQQVAGLPDKTHVGTKDAGAVTRCHELAAHSGDQTNTLGVGVSFDVLKQHAKSAIAACRQAVSDEPNNPRLTFQLARALSAEESFSEALGLYKAAADAGHAAATSGLGLMYARGIGVRRDYAEAIRLFRKAAEKGDARAMYNLGVVYEQGAGVPRDLAESLRWHRKSAELGAAPAMYNLGVMYESGIGVSRDYAEALFWYRKAAEKGDARAIGNLGIMYVQGTGVRHDFAEAVRLFRKAAEKGNARSMYNLGVVYEQGTGVSRDIAESLRWHRKAAEKGDANAMRNLAAMYNKGLGVGRDVAEAARLIARALRQGNEGTIEQMTTNSNAWGRAFRLELQRILKSEGVYQGPIDGSFGPATHKAILKLAGKS